VLPRGNQSATDGIWTSASRSAGFDMSLAMIEQDLGKETAQEVARMLMVHYLRQAVPVLLAAVDVPTGAVQASRCTRVMLPA
jgi:transcriptional regulator GlxA family with amidase domain